MKCRYIDDCPCASIFCNSENQLSNNCVYLILQQYKLLQEKVNKLQIKNSDANKSDQEEKRDQIKTSWAIVNPRTDWMLQRKNTRQEAIEWADDYIKNNRYECPNYLEIKEIILNEEL